MSQGVGRPVLLLKPSSLGRAFVIMWWCSCRLHPINNSHIPEGQTYKWKGHQASDSHRGSELSLSRGISKPRIIGLIVWKSNRSPPYAKTSKEYVSPYPLLLSDLVQCLCFFLGSRHREGWDLFKVIYFLGSFSQPPLLLLPFIW